jgi:hypothetical protein
VSSPSKEAPVAPGSPSISEVITGLAQFALREGIHEIARAQGRRGKLILHVELELGDAGQALYSNTHLHFENKLHVKSARGLPND